MSSLAGAGVKHYISPLNETLIAVAVDLLLTLIRHADSGRLSSRNGSYLLQCLDQLAPALFSSAGIADGHSDQTR